MRSRRQTNQDRHLTLRGDVYYYKRRVPAVVGDLDVRSPHIKISLKTTDLATARAKRDVLEQADHDLWAAMIADNDVDAAAARYRAASKRAEALGFRYMTATEMASRGNVEELLTRIESVMDVRTSRQTIEAVLGLVDRPAVRISEAFKLYTDEIVHHENMGKSESQRTLWRNVKQRAVDLFITLVGDKPIDQITRDDAKVVYDHWRQRIAPLKGAPSHSASSGNRDIGNLRILHDAYFKHMGVDRPNPFDKLTFTDKLKKSRPPFSTDWLRTFLKAPQAIAPMHPEYRGIVLAMIETGARPSELGNLHPEHIYLDGDVRYIEIAPRLDPKSPREIKTATSIRKIPLVGVSLAVFQKHPQGFPHCRDRENAVATTINKFMRENKLWETDKHSLYGLRHSFEDRMKEGGLDHELRMILMGHAIDRPAYGSGGSLEWRRDELLKIALPFDPAIV